jgi:hypothetical protein
MNATTTSSAQTEERGRRTPRRVGGVAAAGFLLAVYNLAFGLATEALLCTNAKFDVGEWAMWARGALIVTAVLLGGWATVRGPSRWLGAVAVTLGLLQAWWLVNDLFGWMCVVAE